MSNSLVRNAEAATAAPLRIGYDDKCRLQMRPGALDTLADAAYDIPRKTDGTPNISALIRKKGAQVTYFLRRSTTSTTVDEILPRVLLLHAQRRGCTPGQALDELFEIAVERAEQRAEVASAA